MTRLEVLCRMHKQQGGTIFQFNQMYGHDFISMSNWQFKMFLAVRFGCEYYNKYDSEFPTETVEGYAEQLRGVSK